MANINQKHLDVFSEAYKTTVDFTEQELARIGELADTLRTIIEAAKSRNQQKFK